MKVVLVENHIALFNKIASVYGLFFNFQIRNYKNVLKTCLNLVDIPKGSRFLDIGCGTGALCHTLNDLGYNAVGIDAASNMIHQARKKNVDSNINFQIGNVLKGLDFLDKSFDIVISSYVVHGLNKDDRYKLYKESSRLARNKIIFHDYNGERRILTDILERLEGGDYFNFIKAVPEEMKEYFSKVETANGGKWASWYICTP